MSEIVTHRRFKYTKEFKAYITLLYKTNTTTEVMRILKKEGHTRINGMDFNKWQLDRLIHPLNERVKLERSRGISMKLRHQIRQMGGVPVC